MNIENALFSFNADKKAVFPNLKNLENPSNLGKYDSRSRFLPRSQSTFARFAKSHEYPER